MINLTERMFREYDSFTPQRVAGAALSLTNSDSFQACSSSFQAKRKNGAETWIDEFFSDCCLVRNTIRCAHV